MNAQAPRVLAHRGASSVFPENTLPALTRALRAPFYADGVELDVRLSADGGVFVFHDPTTNRLAGVPGTIESRSQREVAQLRVAGESVPTLDAAIRGCLSVWEGQARCTLNVEVKLPRDPARAVELLRPALDPLATDPRVELVVSSFDPRVLAQAVAQGAPWRLALLYETIDVLACLESIEGDRPLDLHPTQELVTAEHIEAYAHDARGQRVRALRVWTVDDPWRARALARLGVDAIITNKPTLIHRALWSC